MRTTVLVTGGAVNPGMSPMARAAAGLPASRVTLVRSFTVEKIDSIGP
ncbi:hypothetical protein AB0D98_17755 [Streptomyces sp. NPDC047987]